MFKRNFGQAGCFLLIWVASLALLVRAQEGEKEQGKKQTPAELTRESLDKIVEVEIVEQPLTIAIQQMGDLGKCSIVLDRFSIQNMGYDPESMAVSLKMKNVKLRTALRTILAPHNLGFVVLGDTVVVSTNDMLLTRQVQQRVTIDFDEKPLDKAIGELSRQTATNLVLDPRVKNHAQAPVTLHVDEVPLDTAVRLMAVMADLKVVRTGNVLFITSKETAAELRKDPDFYPQGVNPFDPNNPGVLPPGFFPGANLIGFGGIGGGAPGFVGAAGMGMLGGNLGPAAVPPLPLPGTEVPMTPAGPADPNAPAPAAPMGESP
jgi:hypothetical protein